MGTPKSNGSFASPESGCQNGDTCGGYHGNYSRTQSSKNTLENG